MIAPIKRMLSLAIATAAIVSVLLAATALPASAHSTTLDHGNDYAVTDSNHRSGAICDQEKDGNYVIAYWYNDDVEIIGREEDGGDAGCDQITLQHEASFVQICEYPEVDCTTTHRV